VSKHVPPQTGGAELEVERPDAKESPCKRKKRKARKVRRRKAKPVQA
jgi:hypothetical protein